MNENRRFRLISNISRFSFIGSLLKYELLEYSVSQILLKLYRFIADYISGNS